MPVTYERAAALADKALAEAKAQKLAVAVVVVDEGGHVVAAARMDGAGYFNVDAARGKAAASANFGAPTAAVSHMAKEDALLAAALNAAPGMVILPGGFPILDNGRVAGGLGVAGAHYLQDQAIGEAALR
jgi:glc operon protein GlcG